MKRWRVVAVISMILLSALFPQMVSKAASLGQPVRVGLYYAQTAMPEVRLSSANGLILAELPAGNRLPAPIYAQSGQVSWQVRPDAFRLQFGPYDSLIGAKAVLATLPADPIRFVARENDRYYVRFGAYDTAAFAEQVLKLTSSQPGMVIGCHRVNSAALADLALAETLCDKVKTNGFSAALFRTGTGWQVMVGHETSVDQAESLKAKLVTAFPEESWDLINADLRRSELYSVDGELALSLPPAMDIYIGALGAELGNLENPALVTLHNSTTTNRYRGFVELTLQGNTYRVLLYQTMDQYAMGVVPKEMSYSQPLEALKAQAVIVRTWGEANRGKHGALGFDFDTSVGDQAFTDYSGEGAPSQRAVIETQGMMLTYGGQPVATYYHSDSGGQTEAVENVWGGSAAPWLVSVPEFYPTGSPFEQWEQRYSGAELSALLKRQSIDIGTVVSVKATGYTAAGRVTGLLFVGSAGKTATLSGEASRIRDVNSSAYYSLKSRRFTILPDIPPVSVLGNDGQVQQLRPTGLAAVGAEGTAVLARTDSYRLQGASAAQSSPATASGFVFRGSGNGHGAGLSQWGAYAMAKNGHTYEEILRHYFPGTEIMQLGDCR